MSRLHVVCLISGGKDSLFSILHCIANGHDIVALANLHPPANQDAPVEDLDSYMYQTVGHTVIPLYEEALGLPLYRHEINGTARNQDKCYGLTDDEDETEALVPLLRKVKAHRPELNAVSTGAILSDYQRTRVESVAVRLGLVPLSYLWQWPNLRPNLQENLLSDMAAVGQDSRILKVASGGLDESILWQNVANAQTISRLDKATRRFGTPGDGAVLGEGGEYETLTLAGPSPLWKGRIVVDEKMRKVVSGEAGSASVLVKEARVERRAADQSSTGGLRIPSLLEPRFNQILKGLQTHKLDDAGLAADEMLEAVESGGPSNRMALQHHVLHRDIVGEGSTPERQAHSIMQQAATKLEAVGHTFADVAYTSIILTDMADFASINVVYGSCFKGPNPPARATIACAGVIPDGKHILMSFTSVRAANPNLRKGLHVQSRSYWAPANIGPYSQAIQVPDGDDAGVVYVAGQIPLIPASMELPEPQMDTSGESFMMQTVLALQHLDRIGRVVGVASWNSAAAFIVASSEKEAAARSASVRHAWSSYLASFEKQLEEGSENEAEDESFDVWDTQFGNRRYEWGEPSVRAAERDKGTIVSSAAKLHVIRADTLPRNADVEWVAVGSTDEDRRYEIPHMEHLLATFQGQLIREGL